MRNPAALNLDLRWGAQHSGANVELELAPSTGAVIDYTLEAYPHHLCEIVAQGQYSYTLEAYPQPVCEVSLGIFAEMSIDALPRQTCAIQFAIGSQYRLDAASHPAGQFTFTPGLTFGVDAVNASIVQIRSRYRASSPKPGETEVIKRGPVNLNLRSDGRWFDSGRLDLDLGGAPRQIPRASHVTMSVTAC